jgi:hypothetical protein
MVSAPLTTDLPAQTALWRFWEAQRGNAPMPARSSFELSDLPPVAVPGAILFGIERGTNGHPPSFRIRFAGNDHVTLLGYEISRQSLDEAMPRDAVPLWRDPLWTVIDTAAPASGSVPLGILDRPHLTLHWLRLPLAGPDGMVAHILGHDALVSAG